MTTVFVNLLVFISFAFVWLVYYERLTNMLIIYIKSVFFKFLVFIYFYGFLLDKLCNYCAPKTEVKQV